MSFNTLGDGLKAKASREVHPAISEVAIFKQLIKERVHPLDLIRELLSNCAAEEVRAGKIEISYTQDKDGHIFEVADDGCGMDYTGSIELPGRLDRFIGLGLSGIVGHQADEFSWKGLGSKLSYQSKRVEIETCSGALHKMYDVRVNEPWATLEHNNVPKPRISEHPSQDTGTRVHVIGHPPHRKEDPFTFEQIHTYLGHRTFAGFTHVRKHEPEIWLSVLGRTERVPFGFPEFRSIEFGEVEKDGLKLDEQRQTLFINVRSKRLKSMSVRLIGFVTWDPSAHGLSRDNLNTGLILSVKGIPYLTVDMEDYGSATIRTARPGIERTCLVLECDAIQDEMNISRSGLVDSPKTLELKKVAKELFHQVESSDAYLAFRRIPERRKVEVQGGILAEAKRTIERSDQNWVLLDKPPRSPVVLMREPQNETEVNDPASIRRAPLPYAVMSMDSASTGVL